MVWPLLCILAVGCTHTIRSLHQPPQLSCSRWSPLVSTGCREPCGGRASEEVPREAEQYLRCRKHPVPNTLCDHTVVALSGGTGSALVAYLVASVFEDRTILCIGKSAALQPEKLQRARFVADLLGAAHSLSVWTRLRDVHWCLHCPRRKICTVSNCSHNVSLHA